MAGRDGERKSVGPSPLRQAVGYTLGRWPALLAFLEDGRVPMTNNAAERALRRIAVGRKNWLFAGSDAGAQRAAIAYSVLATCRLQGVSPGLLPPRRPSPRSPPAGRTPHR
ncbi:MAG: transposase [Deltaproteobacteria bacterium]|nr:transposase [Deltaproteobacteria bacterium]